MADDNARQRIDEVAASGGRKEGVVRWVLGIGTLLAIVLLTVVWMTGALTQGDQEEAATASENIDDANQDTGTDSIVGDGQDADEGVASDRDQLSDGLEVIENDPVPEPTAT